MRKLFVAFAILASMLLAQPSFAECGTCQVSYLRSSQRESGGTDFRLKVDISESVSSDTPIVDVKTAFIGDSGYVAYSFPLSRIAGLTQAFDSAGGWTYEERTDTTYARIRLVNNSDGTSTLRVAMGVPYTVFNVGLGYYASIRSCE